MAANIWALGFLQDLNTIESIRIRVYSRSQYYSKGHSRLMLNLRKHVLLASFWHCAC